MHDIERYLKGKGIQYYYAFDIEYCVIRIRLRLDDIVTELRFRQEDMQDLDYFSKRIKEACDLLLESKAQHLHTS